MNTENLARQLGLAFNAVAEGNQKNCALTLGVGAEEAGHVVIVKGQASSA
jgi:hypothetical protein